MADRYWRGGSGTWSSTTRWSETSGGAGGASVPGVGDTAIFDANSGLNLKATINTAPLCAIAPITGTGFSFELSAGVTFSLLGNLTGLYRFYVYGTLTTNNYNIDLIYGLEAFSGSTLNFGTSTIAITRGASGNSYIYLEAGTTADIDEATFTFESGTADGSKLYIYNSDAHSFGTIDVTFTAGTYKGLIFYEEADFEIGSLSVSGDGYIDANAASELTILDTLSLEGATSGGLRIESANLSFVKSSGTVSAANCTLQNSLASGGAIFNAFTADGNVDEGDNVGWIFKMPGSIPMLDVDSYLEVIRRPDFVSMPEFDFYLKTMPGMNATLSFSFLFNATLGQNQPHGPLWATIFPVSVTAYGGGYFNQKIKKITLAASGSIDNIGFLSKQIPKIVLTASAVQEVLGAATLKIPLIRLSAAGVISPTGSLIKQILAIRMSSAATLGIVGNLSKSVAAVIIDASAYWQSENSATLSIPALRVYANAQSAIWEIISLNVKNLGLTNYSNYDYNSMSLFDGNVFGAKSDGIYLLSGDDDDGEDIPWSLKTGKIDIENQLSQKARHVWLSRRSSGDLLLIVDDGEQEYEYPVTAYNESDDAVRVKLGKGIRSKYIQLELKNITNETLRLDSLKIFADRTSKKR